MSLTLYGRVVRSSVYFIEKPGARFYRMKAARGKPPELAKNLEQRLAELKYQDPALHYRVNIGLPLNIISRKDVMKERHTEKIAIKKNHELELAARHRTIKLDLEKVYDEWQDTVAAKQIYETAKYYNVYEDLFEESYFYPVVPLNVGFTYPKDETLVTPVYRGNLIKPYEATEAPEVCYPADKNDLFTLALTTPDCHFTQENGEYLHWLIGNIPGSDIQKGEIICDYMRPFPVRGIGYCRYIFVLYKQEEKIDFSSYTRKLPCTNLTARTFSTFDFYRSLQDQLTPAGLAFFESTWDHSLTEFFHDVLDMAEPVAEYDFPPIKLSPQKWFPHKRPFNLYLDMYKEPKQLQKELLIEKLKERHPFKPAPIPPKFPLAYKIDCHLPTWLKTDLKLRRMKEGKYKFL